MNKILQKAWQFIKSSKVELLIMVIVVIADLLSKQIVESTMNVHDVIKVIPGFFNINFIYNERAAYGMSFGLEHIVGEDGVIVAFIVITILAIIAFGFFWVKDCNRNWMFRTSLALIIGGAFGNLVDRITLNAVRDFLQIIVFNEAIFGCFNIADVALVAGVIAFAIYFIFMLDKDEKRIKQEAEAGNEANISTEEQQQVEILEDNSAKNDLTEKQEKEDD